jgi:predicted aconitase
VKLTREQKGILDGEQGEILQWAMSCLVKYGTAMEADELIPVTSVHTFIGPPEQLARNFSPPGTDITLERIAEVKKLLAPLRAKVKTTTSPPPTFQKNPPHVAIDTAFGATDEASELTRTLGIQLNSTCTPYLVGNVPVMGETCSWLESSAIIYINSILGAHTNRDGVESTLFSSLLGLTPRFGLHLDENRKGTHLIQVQCEVQGLSDWGALGYFAGEIAGVGVPVFANLRRPTLEEAKQLSASLAASGGVSLFHIAGITPEAQTTQIAFGGHRPIETRIFDEPAKREIYERLNYEAHGKVGLVCIGCPNVSLAELQEVARLIEGRHVAEGTLFWVMIDYATRALAERQGCAQIIESAGGQFTDRCPVSIHLDTSRIDRMATYSAKMAHYARDYLQSKVFFGSLERCIEIAMKGGS